MNMRFVARVSVLIVSFTMILSVSSGAVRAQDAKKMLSIEAWDMLNTVPDSYLIDVRTRAEYQFVGHPLKAYLYPYMFLTTDLAKEGEGYTYQLSPKNKTFVDEISKAFKKSDNLLLISRDGIRSAMAARDLIDAGFKKVIDVEDGFEGPKFPADKDSNRHKFYRQLAKTNKIYGFDHRRRYGWQAWGLPWTYDMDPKYLYPPDLAPPKK